MGAVSKLKQISLPVLELLQQNPSLASSFFAAKYLLESPRMIRWTDQFADQTKQKANFLAEWTTPELDLNKSWDELTFFLAGYIPCHVTSGWIAPDLRVSKIEKSRKLWNRLFSFKHLPLEKDFLPFLVVETSAWDKLPLVNAIGTGKEIDYETGYGPVRYLLPQEVEQVLDGLLKLSESGFQQRFRREAAKAERCPWIDWSDPEEMLESMTDYYNEIVGYYRAAAIAQSAMLLYLI
jgi:hypothetical protein